MAKSKLIPAMILEKTIDELLHAGMMPDDIVKTLDVPKQVVYKMLPKNFWDDYENYPGSPNKTLINQILYDAGYPVATQVIIDTEKRRFEEYSRLESICLQTLQRIASSYAEHQFGTDVKGDKEIAKFMTDCIKVTQQAREEVLKKYAIDKSAGVMIGVQTEDTQKATEDLSFDIKFTN